MVQFSFPLSLVSLHESNITKQSTVIAKEFIDEVNPTKTFRGRVDKHGIQLLNDSKQEKYYYKWIL